MAEIATVLPFKVTCESDKEKWRHDTFWKKEPECVAWIKSFGEEDLFFDIGANIGLYSLYFASLYPKGLCIAVEPMIANAEAMRQNMSVNDFNNIMIEPTVFSNKTEKMPLYIPDLQRGASGSQMYKPIDEHGKEFTKLMRMEDMTAFSFSNYIKLFDGKPHKLTGRATHIKIDVDGQEDKVLAGIKDFTDIKSILVEFNKHVTDSTCEVCNEWIDILGKEGFTSGNKYNKMPDHSTVRREKEEGNIARNVVFVREG